MAIYPTLATRSGNICELCSSTDDNLVAYAVPPKTDDSADNQVVLCTNGFGQISSNNTAMPTIGAALKVVFGAKYLQYKH